MSNVIVKQISFDEPVIELVLSENHSVQLTALPLSTKNGWSRKSAVDVQIAYQGTQTILPLFAEVYWAGHREPEGAILEPQVIAVIMENKNSHLALIGSTTVVYLNSEIAIVTTILHMFREEDRDHGFEQMDVIPLEDGFLMRYENGVARIRWDGDVVWHRELTWNDIFQTSDAHYLYYWSEFADAKQERKPGDYAIAFSDGGLIQKNSDGDA